MLKRGRKKTDPYFLLKELLRAFEILGHTPSQEWLDNNPDFPSRNAYRNCFGSFRKAQIAAGLPLNSRGKKPGEPKFTEEEKKERERDRGRRRYREHKRKGTPFWKVRFEILKRDDFTCQYCGRTPQAGAKLEVDHILPRSKGGKTTPANLITACMECNRGKNNSLLDLHAMKRLIKKEKPERISSVTC